MACSRLLLPSEEQTRSRDSAGELEIDGLPMSRPVYEPHLKAGRWLTNHEDGTLVLSDIAAQRLHMQLGDDVAFRQETPQAQQKSWKVVGIVHELANASGSASATVRLGLAFTTLNNLQTLLHLPAEDPPGIWVFTRDHSAQALRQLRSQVVTVFEQDGLQEDLSTPLLDQAVQPNPLLVVYALFDTVAILIAFVGLLSLSNTLAASVLERRREIGILRTLGASGWRVGAVFWTEGLALAMIAWGIGMLLGPPGGIALLDKLSTFTQPFDVIINPIVILTTLLFVVAVSSVSSFGPALSAARLRISETLRYE